MSDILSRVPGRLLGLLAILLVFIVIALGIAGYGVDTSGNRIQLSKAGSPGPAAIRALGMCAAMTPTYSWVAAPKMSEVSVCNKICKDQPADDRECVGIVMIDRNGQNALSTVEPPTPGAVSACAAPPSDASFNKSDVFCCCR